MKQLAAVLVLLFLATGCGSAANRGLGADVGYKEKGVASWYGPGFDGKRTANGEVYDMDGLTAAHRSLPFDLIVQVENLDNGEKVRVRINDRGPFARGRIIDLSREAAKRIDMIGTGTANVRIKVVEGPQPIERTGSFWVQVGAFRDRRYARDLQSALDRSFPSVEIRSGDGWYRVGFGPYEKRGKADEMIRKLARDGHEAFAIDID